MKVYTIEKMSLFLCCSLAVLCGLSSCHSVTSGANDLYTPDDFSRVKKIDIHAHIFSTDPAVIEQGKKDNVGFITINVDVPGTLPIDSQQYYALQQQHRFPNDIHYMTAFSTHDINEPGWSDRQLTYLKNSFDSGALGIKVWKNIGMVIRDKDSNFIMIDNPVFDPIFNYLEQHKIPVIGHIGEPKNCWLPLDQMTTINDRNYFKAHPEYHMYLHPEFPSYEAQILSRDHLLEKHPGLIFIGAHLGSLEWDTDEIAKRLEKFPNMSVETAERFGQLQYQSISNWQKVHDFFIKYQDRIMYGTDFEVNVGDNPDSVKKKAHTLWMRDLVYLTSGDSLQSPFVSGRFKGLALPKEVVDKFYFKNVDSLFFNKKN